MKKIFYALLAIGLLSAAQPARAAQVINNAIDATTESGTQLATDLNNSFTSLISTSIGTSRPSYAVEGTLWVKSVSSTLRYLNVYDGSSDLAFASYNPSTHVLTVTAPATTKAAGDSSTSIATTAFVNGTALTLANGTTATTQASTDNSTKVATTAYVKTAVAGLTSGFTSCTTVSAVGTTANNIISVSCSAGYTMTGGGCDGLTQTIVASYPSTASTWYCKLGNGIAGRIAYAVCCH